MKLIDVLIKLSKGEKFKYGTILTINDKKKYRQYKYIGNCFLDEYNLPLIYGENDLNSEVTFIEPETKKYYLRLHGGTSNFRDYINRHNENFGLHSYIIDDDEECNGYYTKFTQDEIDNDEFLKFVEKHGVKEEVEENENY